MMQFLENWGGNYPILGADKDGDFMIPEPPKWVAYVMMRGIDVRQGAWGMVRQTP